MSHHNSASDRDEDDDAFVDGDLFREPEGFRPPEKQPTFAEHTLLSGQKVKLRLVGHNPLWGHLLWNAGKTISNYIEEQHGLIANKSVLELGAGAGLPSLTCAINGARTVVVTDYSDPDLVQNLAINIEQCDLIPASCEKIVAKGFIWGADPTPLLAELAVPEEKFDILILADLLFNHSEHQKMLASVQATMKKTKEARALVFFTPYRPWLLEKDLDFFRIADEGGFVVEKLFEKVMDKVMFEEDPGDELLRRTVFGYQFSWKEEQLS